jgi:hypothetical protein
MATPKRITDKELNGTSFKSGFYGGVKKKGMFDSEGLNDHELSTLKGIMSGHQDEDSKRYGVTGRRYGGINEGEAMQIIEQVKHHPDFNAGQKAHIEKNLKKYLDKKGI